MIAQIPSLHSRVKIATGFLMALVAVLSPGRIAAQDSYSWSSVKIGGGGYITSLIIHPANSSVMYARTDVGGAYRWNAASSSWSAITDWITVENVNLYGIESIAIDPSNTNTVYIACGKDLGSSPHGVYKSTDQGNTWS